jgi:hypothetical protein
LPLPSVPTEHLRLEVDGALRVVDRDVDVDQLRHPPRSSQPSRSPIVGPASALVPEPSGTELGQVRSSMSSAPPAGGAPWPVSPCGGQTDGKLKRKVLSRKRDIRRRPERLAIGLRWRAS